MSDGIGLPRPGEGALRRFAEDLVASVFANVAAERIHAML